MAESDVEDAERFRRYVDDVWPLVSSEPVAEESWFDRLLPIAAYTLETTTQLSRRLDRLALRDHERELAGVDERTAAILNDLADADLRGLLEFMGHRPPPDGRILALDVRQALRAVVRSGPDRLVAASHVRAAQQALALYNYQLRELIEVAPEVQDFDRAARRRQIADAVQVGVSAVAVAGLAASVPALGGLGVAGAVLNRVVEATAEDATKKALEIGFTTLIGRIFQRLPGPVDGRLLRQSIVDQLRLLTIDLAREFGVVPLDDRAARALLLESDTWLDALGRALDVPPPATPSLVGNHRLAEDAYRELGAALYGDREARRQLTARVHRFTHLLSMLGGGFPPPDLTGPRFGPS